MAKKVYEEQNISNIAIAIREKTGSSKTYKTSEMPSGINEVYEAGRGKGYYDGYHNGLENGIEEGYNNGYTKGETDGRQAEYDEFWDNIIDGVGTTFPFCGTAWNNNTFHPNKDLVVPNWCQRYFARMGNTDVKARLEEKGLKLDLFSKCKNITYLVEIGGGLTALPELDTRNISSLNYFVYNCANLVSIDKVILKDDGTQTFANTSFGSNSALTHVIFEGCIGQSFSIAQSPLDAESAKSIINCLKDYSGTDNEFAYTLSLSSTAKANLEALGNTAPEGVTWLEYARDIKCWNV